MKTNKSYKKKQEKLNSTGITNVLTNNTGISKIGDKKILKQKAKKTKRGKKVKTVFKICVSVIFLAALSYLLYNKIQTDKFNKVSQVKDPHNSAEVLDSNGKDFDIDNNGQIVLDSMTEHERQVILDQLSTLFINDANGKIEKITDLVSLSLLPYNLCDKDNEDDKYYLSALVRDDKDFYTINYSTGKDFESDAIYEKNYFMDFINYLNNECAIDFCEKMTEKTIQIKSLLDPDVVFVGSPYMGIKESGDEYYFVPVYNQNGQGTVYYSWATPLIALDIDPLDQLYQELAGDQEKKFISTPFIKSNSLDKISQIYHEQLTEKTKEPADAQIFRDK